jgi:hypothetical protein
MYACCIYVINHPQAKGEMKMASPKSTEITVLEIKQGIIDCCVKGNSPIILNAMSAKARQELLMPRGRKNAAEKASSLKHEPLQEYRSSMYFARNPESPTRVVVKSTAFKNALRSAALDLPGSSKAQIGRLTYIMGDEVSLYGIPELMMSVTRSADIKRTPDVRTRAVMPKWAARFSVKFTQPLLKEQAVVNLLAAAGVMQGIGDWRPEKGSGDYGQFELVSPDDAEFKHIIETGGKKAQDAAIDNPECYDSETEELLNWFDVEVKRRGFKVVS